MSILIPYVFGYYGFIECSKYYKLKKLFIYISRILFVSTIIYWISNVIIYTGIINNEKESKLWGHIYILSTIIRYTISLMLMFIISIRYENILNIQSLITNNLTKEYRIKMRKINLFNSSISLLLGLITTLINYLKYAINNPFAYTFNSNIFGIEITYIIAFILEWFYSIFVLGIMNNVILIYINFYLGAHYLR